MLKQTVDSIEASDSNFKLAAEQTLRATASTESINQQFTLLADRMNDISSMTQQNLAAVEEVNANMEQQHEQIQVMSSQFEQLDKLVSELNELVEKR